MSQTIRAARAVHRVLLDIFNGIKAALHIPIVAGLASGGVTFLWLSLLLPGGMLR